MSFQADKAIYKPLNNIHVTDKKDVASEDISTKNLNHNLHKIQREVLSLNVSPKYSSLKLTFRNIQLQFFIN